MTERELAKDAENRLLGRTCGECDHLKDWPAGVKGVLYRYCAEIADGHRVSDFACYYWKERRWPTAA